MRFGQRIRELREAAGLTQPALARAVGVSQAAISQIEAGDNRDTKHLFRLAKALKVSPHHLNPDIPASSGRPPDDLDEAVSEVRALSAEQQAAVLKQLKGTIDLVKKLGKTTN